jgi:hypothetical protein
MTGDHQTEVTESGDSARRRQFSSMLDCLSTHGFALVRLRQDSPAAGPTRIHYELQGRRASSSFWGTAFRRVGQVLDFDEVLDQRPVVLVLFDMEPAQTLSYLQERLDIPAIEREPVHTYLDPRSCLDAVRRRMLANNAAEPRKFDVLYARNDGGIALLFVHRDPSGPYQARTEDLRDDAPWEPEALVLP